MNQMTTTGARAGVWRAPGRANVMGEHTDYNQGLVLPFAIAQSVTVSAVHRDDGMLLLRSRHEPAESATLALVPTHAGPAVRAAIADAFARHSWAAPEFIETVPSGGASRADTRHGR